MFTPFRYEKGGKKKTKKTVEQWTQTEHRESDAVKEIQNEEVGEEEIESMLLSSPTESFLIDNIDNTVSVIRFTHNGTATKGILLYINSFIVKTRQFTAM